MDLEDLPPRAFAAVGLLALVPIAWYGLSLSPTAAAFAAVNVAIVIAAIYVAMGQLAGADDGHHGDDGEPTA